MFPTPRRALFTTAAMMDSIGCRGKPQPAYTGFNWTEELTTHAEYVTTPPLPLSSSPAHIDMMDMSPLPHKAPFAAQMEVASPSPAPLSADEMLLESPAPRQASLEPPKPVVAE